MHILNENKEFMIYDRNEINKTNYIQIEKIK